MKYVLRTKIKDNCCRYLLDDNLITVKTFYNKTSAFKYLYDYLKEFKDFILPSELKGTDWECITFNEFKDDLAKSGPLIW